MKQAGLVLIVRDVPQSKGGTERQLLVVTNRRFGGYALPGGKVEAGDPSPRFAARRELREETSLLLIDTDASFLLSAINVVNEEDCEVSVFFARSVWGTPRNVEDGTSFAWFAWSKFLDSTPFLSFYKKHFPDGLTHLVPTVMSAP